MEESQMDAILQKTPEVYTDAPSTTADTALVEGNYRSAIAEYTALLRTCKGKHAALVHRNRSAAFASMSYSLRMRPASHSEDNALFGQDPTQIAELALKDAEKALHLEPDSARGYHRKAAALFLAEDYTGAREAFFEGMLLDPTDAELAAGLRAIDERLSEAEMPGPAPEAPSQVPGQPSLSRTSSKRRRVEPTEDFDCTVCYKMLFEPVTTPCGHSFCRECFERAIEHQPKCPLCRTVLHTGRRLPVTLVLANLLRACFPDEYAERAQEHAAARGLADEATASGDITLPLFIMSCLFPGSTIALNIFEPRYRLMTRRCMEGSRRFGMAVMTNVMERETREVQRKVHPIATEVEITDCQLQPDGRYYLEIKGVRRIVVCESWELDGYRVGRVRPLTDEEVQSAEEANEIQAFSAEVRQLAVDFGARLARLPESMPGVRRIVEQLRELPSVDEPEALGLFVASLVPMDTNSEMQLLATRSTLGRLKAVKEALTTSETSPGRSTGCQMM